MSVPTEYTTRSMDMWDLISFRLFGTEYNSDALQYANPNYALVWQFDSGVVLNVPQNIQPKVPINSPPWVVIASPT